MLHAVGDVDDDNDDGGGGCADDDSVIFECFFNFVFVYLITTQKRVNASLIIGISLVFLSSVLSARITSDTGCFRNMAGSWGKVLAKACRVRNPSSVHVWSMYAGGTEPPLSFCSPPPHISRFFIFYIFSSGFFFFLCLIFSLFVSVAG